MEQIIKLFLKEQKLEGTFQEYKKFIDCDFSEGDLGNQKFIDCEFVNCNFTLSKMRGVSFQGVKFKSCKLLGLRFDQCSAFALSFEFDNCILDHAVFHQLRISKTKFSNCRMQEVDFTGADLTAAVFANCNLQNAIFESTKLEACDLTGAHNLQFDLDKNFVQKLKITAEQLPALLQKFKLNIVY
jgi:uncharacterized protein YjbI with pentapeptide repeats